MFFFAIFVDFEIIDFQEQNVDFSNVFSKALVKRIFIDFGLKFGPKLIKLSWRSYPPLWLSYNNVCATFCRARD